MLVLDQIQTLAFAGLSLFAGFGVLRAAPLLSRLNIPAPVIGGLLVALAILLGRQWNVALVSFDTRLQTPLMIAFFTAIGCNASVSLLKASGRQVVLFLLLATFLAVIQSLIGMLVARAFGLHPLFGVLAGTTTLAGGPATGLAFAPLFEQAGVHGAQGIAIAMAMAGIVSGGLLGGPIATWLIQRHGLESWHVGAAKGGARTELKEMQPESGYAAVRVGQSASGQGGAYVVLKGLIIVLLAMWIGGELSARLDGAGLRLPAYIGAMLVGALIRNVDDRTGWIGLSHGVIENIGSICLAFFLALALMNLKLWELSGLALPLILNLCVQIVLVAAFCWWPLFALMGRDYDSAVMAGGFVGFMLGITANAMAVMQALVQRYGPAPRAFLVAPLVGAFFIDFSDALIITTFINLLG
jgi:glutamate:Na+ symporter, ESS family